MIMITKMAKETCNCFPRGEGVTTQTQTQTHVSSEIYLKMRWREMGRSMHEIPSRKRRRMLAAVYHNADKLVTCTT